MILDFEDPACPTQWDADVCIVGAGAAGLCLAREFIGAARKVVVLEGGGNEVEARTHALYRAISVGESYFGGWHYGRMRVLGGATTAWSGQALPLMPEDFAARPWVPHSGWPIAHEEVAAFFARAETFLGLEHGDYGEGAMRRLDAVPLGFDPDFLVQQFSRFAPQPDLRRVYRKALQADRTVGVLLHANTTELVLDASGDRIASVRFSALGGRTGEVRPRAVVLAAGGIESARLLLASRSSRGAGLGNEHDQVGRYFQDHLVAHLGFIEGPDPRSLQRLLNPYLRGRQRYGVRLALAPGLQAREQILNLSAMAVALEPEDSAPAVMRKVLRDVRGGSIDRNTWRAVLGALRRGGDAFDVLTERYLRGRVYAPGARLVLEAYCEQAPDPDSRVRLHRHETDALGMPLSEIDWRLGEVHGRTFRAAADTFRSALANACGASVKLARWLRPGEDWRANVRDQKHHMGTCRMSAAPAQGVVDRECRVHTVPNLYVAGSAVFPTSGHANPTLTLLALAIRLADHLKRALA